MGWHEKIIRKIRNAGYRQENFDDAVKAFLLENKDYSDDALAKKIKVSTNAIFNWRKKFSLVSESFHTVLLQGVRRLSDTIPGGQPL